MLRDIDAEHDELMDELEKAVDEVDDEDRGERIRVVRVRIEDLIREQEWVALPDNSRPTAVLRLTR